MTGADIVDIGTLGPILESMYNRRQGRRLFIK